MNVGKNVEPVRIRSTPTSRTIAFVMFIFAIATLVLSGLETYSLLNLLRDGTILASVPIDPEHLELITKEWEGEVTGVGTTFAAVTVTGATDDLVEAFAIPIVLSGALTMGLAFIAMFTILSLYVGRLSWVLLSWIAVLGGVIVAAGSVIRQSLQTRANEDLSIWLYGQEDGWLEPGFMEGFEFLSPAIGISIALIGWSLRTAGRFAEEADGVV